MRRMMWRLGELVRDVGYGIHAGNAIRHGVPAPEGARQRPNQRPTASVRFVPGGRPSLRAKCRCPIYRRKAYQLQTVHRQRRPIVAAQAVTVLAILTSIPWRRTRSPPSPKSQAQSTSAAVVAHLRTSTASLRTGSGCVICLKVTTTSVKLLTAPRGSCPQPVRRAALRLSRTRHTTARKRGTHRSGVDGPPTRRTAVLPAVVRHALQAFCPHRGVRSPTALSTVRRWCAATQPRVPAG